MVRIFLKVVLLALVPWIVASDQDKQRFLGGTMSYTTRLESNGKYKADVELITGWILGSGPCGPGCNKSKLGSSTLSTRHQIEQSTTDPYFFGRFFTDEDKDCTGSNCIHNTITNTMTEEVLALNEEALWEQDILKFSMCIDNNTKDINFEGDFWRPLNLQGTYLKWHVQAPFDSKIRNDTNKPNSLPEVLGRPFYRVKLGKITTIKMAVSDPDEDVLKCDIVKYVEGGAISSHRASGVTVSEDCTVIIDASATNNYTDDTWIAVAALVRDYNTEIITYGQQKRNPVEFTGSLQYTSFQFVVNVLENLSPPNFVSPTPPNRHTFILYIGALWTVDVYAEASVNTTIASFEMISRRFGGLKSQLKKDTKRDRVSYITLTWKPLISEIGTHTVCILARDNTGVDSSEDNCMFLHVKADQFQHNTNALSLGKPVFIDIPAPAQIINCPIHTTCFVPLYVKSSVEVVSVHIERFFTYDAKVGSIIKLPLRGNDVYKTDLSFRDVSHGLKQLCFKATDKNGVSSDETCIMSEIEPSNPCVSSPCRNSAPCSVDTQTGTFICRCLPGSSGKRCENRENPCLRNPCLNGAFCSKSTGRCSCLTGFTGTHCEIDINYCTTNVTCSLHGTCKDGKSNYSCECIDRYNGTQCEHDRCPNEGPEKAACPVAGCTNINCHGHGLCIEGGVCKCSSGYRGVYCDIAKGNISSNAEVAFVPPTLQAGSSVVCYVKGNVVQPCAVDAFIVTQTGEKPNVTRRMSHELDIGSTTRPVGLSQDVSGVSDMYYTTLIVKGNVSSLNGHYACIITSHGTSQVERCFKIVLRSNPEEDISTLQHAQKDASTRFIDPTPKDGSILICYRNVTCNVVLYTHNLDKHTDCHDVITTTKDVFVFKSHRARTIGPCAAEVSFLFDRDIPDREICFHSALVHYQQRCFKVILYTPNSDPCDNAPCYNGGHCIRTGQDKFICECKPNFVGDNCESGPCMSAENLCQNNGYCQKHKNSALCSCQLGFMGSQCELYSGNSTLTSAALFTDTAKPETFQCVIDQPCGVSLVSGGVFPANQRPTVDFGYMPPVFDIIRLNTESLQTNTELFQTNLILKGRKEGLYKMCLQIKNQHSTITDEMCFNVNVITDVISVNGVRDRPYFIEPSLPTNTVVECAENSICHVIYHATPGEGNNGQCVSTKLTMSDELPTFHLFSTCDQCSAGGSGSSNCSMDVSLTTPSANGQNISICIELSLKGTNIIGEERCFNLLILTKAKALERKGCQLLQCTNGGFCDGRDENQPFCVCPRKSSGTLCEKDATHVDPSVTSSSSFVGDMAIPKELTCGLMGVCAVPFQVVSKPGENITSRYGYLDLSLRNLGKQYSDNTTGRLLIIPTKPGTFKVCQQMVHTSLTADEVCTTLNVQSVTERQDTTRPYFLLPTPGSESTVMCNIDTSCHLDIHFAKFNETGNGGIIRKICPDLTLTEGSTVDKLHIFDVTDTTSRDCAKDVSMIQQTETVRRLCLQVVVPGRKGETRCFNIQFVNDLFNKDEHPCRGYQCLNDGRCLAVFRTSTPTASCMCPNGFSGSQCQLAVIGNDTLPGVSNLTIPLNAKQYFDKHSAIPTHVQCQGTEPCCVSVPYFGSNTLMPVIGYQDSGLNVLNNSVYTPLVTKPNYHVMVRCFSGTPGQTHRVCYQTTVDGTSKSTNVDEMCFEIDFKSSGTHSQASSNIIHGLPDGSHFTCLPNTICHIPVRTERKSGQCGSIKQCGNGMPGVHIFPSTVSGGICVTDVAISTGDDGIKETLCIASGVDERHLEIESNSPTSKGYGPCQALHCQNGGLCKSQAAHHAVCECPIGYSGETCEKKENSAHFDHRYAVPSVVSCDDQKPCCVSMAYKGSQNHPPVISRHDTDLNITYGPSTTVNDMDHPDVYITKTCVKGTVGSEHKLCMALHVHPANPTNNKTEETCFVIENHHKVSQTSSVQPKFEKSLPDGTRVVCKPNDLCHLPIITTAVNGVCEKSKSCNGSFVASSPVNDNGLCRSTVTWVTGSSGSLATVCITAGTGGEERHILADIKGLNFTDNSPCKSVICNHGGRCIMDTSVSPQTPVCVCTSGFEGTTCETAVNKTTGLPGVVSVQGSVINQHFVGDMAVPDTIQCDEINPCCLNVPYYGDPKYPPILGHVDNGLEILGPPTTSQGLGMGTESTESLNAVTCVKGTPGTPHKICFQTTTNGTKQGMNIDELCFKVEIKQAGNPNPVDIPHFDTSSFQNGTTLRCQPQTNCHIPFTTLPDNGVCHKVTTCDGSNNDVQAFITNLVGQKCLTEVAFKTGQVGTTTNVCVLAGDGGEKRQISVDTKTPPMDGFGLCKKLHCHNGGICRSSIGMHCYCPDGIGGFKCDNNVCEHITCNNGGKCITVNTSISSPKGGCMCSAGFAGTNCQDVVNKTAGLPGVINVPSGNLASQNFIANTGVPKDVKCDQINPCCISVPYFGEQTKPPTLGYHDSELKVQVGPYVINQGMGSTDSRIAVTCVNGTLGNNQRLCLQTTTNGTQQGMNIDEVCFNVHTEQGGQKPPEHVANFHSSTLPDGTSVICQPNSDCHVPFTTTKQNGTCQQVTVCNVETDKSTHIFETTMIGNKCVTDVVIKTKSDGSHSSLCVSAGEFGEQRTLQVESKDMTSTGFGPCQKLHCENGGTCLSLSSTTAKCVCTEGYVGKSCDTSYCNGLNCQNGGKCVVDNSTSTPKGVCLCPSDFGGNLCQSTAQKSTSLPGIKDVPSGVNITQHFVGNSAVPTDIQCDGVNPCCISVPYYGTANFPPIVAHHDSSLTVTNGPSSLQSKTGSSNSQISVTCVNGTLGQQHKLCLQTTTNGSKEGMNIDEICVNVHVNHNGHKSSQNEPHFDESTVTNGSHVVCQPNDVCHLPVITAQQNGQCQQVKLCDPVITGEHVFNTTLVGDKCISDVVMKTGTAGSKTMCISAGNSGEERHLVVETKNSTNTGFGPCQKLHCKNGGSCDHSLQNDRAVCQCPFGFTGNDCAQSVCNVTACLNGGLCVADINHPHGICICTSDKTGPNCQQAVNKTVAFPGTEGLPPNTHPTQQFIGTSAVPKHITCDEVKPCCISIPYFGNKDLPPIIGYSDKNMEIISGPSSVTPDSTKPQSHIATTCVKGEPGESNRLCLQTTTDGTEKGVNVDEICVDVQVQTGGQIPLVSSAQPHFTKSLPDGSTIVCQPNAVCHVPVTTAPVAGACTHISTCNNKHGNAYILNTERVGDQCITDVAITTGAAATTDLLCISAGSGGEKRNITVETKNVTNTGFGPCGQTHCLNGGRCKSYTNGQAVCACQTQFSGVNCEIPIQKPTPCQSVTCNNGGMCIVDSQTNTKCVCAVGFSGSSCDKVEEQLSIPNISGTTTSSPLGYTPSYTNNNSSHSTGIQSHHNFIPQTFYNNTALPKHIECDPYKPCCLPVPYHGEKDLPPMLGYHDEDLKILNDSEVVTVDYGGNSKSHVAELCVEGKPGQVHRLCLQTTINGTAQGVNFDEICVGITVKTPDVVTNQQHSAPGPHFMSRLPDRTELVCQPNTMCHVPVSTENTDGFCEQVTTCIPGQSDVHVFPTQTTDNKCVTDVVVQAKNEGTKTDLCLSAGSDGEKLNYVVKASHEDAFGPCRELHCQNGGTCLSESENLPAVCKCASDFTGTECEAGPQCSKEDIEHARTMVVTGYASCSCVVNGEMVDIVKKRPVVKNQTLYSAAGFGAGGMVGTMAVGVLIYAIVNKLRQPQNSFRPRSPSSRVYPSPNLKVRTARKRNMDF